MRAPNRKAGVADGETGEDMRQWEYIELTVLIKVAYGTRDKITRIDDNTTLLSPEVNAANGEYLEWATEGNEVHFPMLHSYLNKLGQEGWELISVVRGGAAYYGKTDYLYCYLKRPKQE